jgi:potassium/hydrogen antiporter
MAASRLRLPALLLFLGVGMAVGSDGLGWIYLDDYSLARLVGTVAPVVILFEGGLQTGFGQLRPVMGSAVSLAVVGTALTALVTGIAASLLLHFSLAEGLLLGAILSSTDGAAVFALLRGVRLPRRLANASTGTPLVASFATAAIAFGAAGTLGGSGFSRRVRGRAGPGGVRAA